MQKMHISFLKELRNFEFSDFFDAIDLKLDHLNVEEHIYLQQIVEVIKDTRKQLLMLKHSNLGHPLTKVINDKVQARTEYLACLRMKIDAELRSHLPENRVAAKPLKEWHSSYKDELHLPSIHVQKNLVKCMMQEREEYAFLKDATKQLQLDDLLEAIMQVTNEIDSAYAQRSHEVNHIKTVGNGLREKAYKDLQILINAVDMSYKLGNCEQRKQMSQLWGEICNTLKSFHTALKSRRTKSKNKRELNTAVKELLETKEELISSSQTSLSATANRNLPMVIYDALKINDKSQAPTSNPFQKAATKITPALKFSEKDKGKIASTENGLDSSLSKKNNTKGSASKVPQFSSTLNKRI